MTRYILYPTPNWNQPYTVAVGRLIFGFTVEEAGDTNAPAGLAAATGDAPQPEVTVGANAGSPTAAGSALQPTVVTGTNAPAGFASATGDAPQPEVTIAPNAGNASSVGSAPQPEATVALNASAAAGTGTPLVALEYRTPHNANTPDHASFAITDLDIEVTLGLQNWAPGGSIGFGVIGQTNIIANIGPTLTIAVDGKIQIGWSTDGGLGTATSVTTTAAPGLAADTEHTIRATLDVDNGAAGKTWQVFVDGTLFETASPAGTTSIFNSPAAFGFGFVAGAQWQGYIRSGKLRDSIGGTEVTNPDFSAQAPGTTSFADATGKTWTVTGLIRPNVAKAAVAALPVTPEAAGTAPQPTVQTTGGALPTRPTIATAAAVGAASQRYRRQPSPIIDLGAPLAQPETQAPAGLADAAGTALQPTVDTGAAAAPPPRPVVATDTAVKAAIAARRRQATAQFVELGPSVPQTQVFPTVAEAAGTALQPEAEIGAKPSAPTAAGTAPQPTVQTGADTNAPAGLASAAGTAAQPEAEIGAKPNTPIAAGTAPQPTVITGTLANAGLAAGTGTANAASVTIRPNAGVGLAAGVANQPEAEIGAKPGFGLAVGTAPQPTVTFGALAQAGLAAATGTAFAPKIAIRVPAGVAAAAGEAFPVFGLEGNPLGDPQGIVAVDDDHSLTARDGRGLIAIDDDHSLEA
jgi:hypothetical protein